MREQSGLEVNFSVCLQNLVSKIFSIYSKMLRPLANQIFASGYFSHLQLIKITQIL